jgi:tripartite-type tricarboxylate transporter receptor subunit TctC
MIQVISTAVPHVKSGRARAIAVTGNRRSAALRSSNMVQQLNARGIDLTPSSPAEYLKFARAEQKRWLSVIGEAEIKAE